MAVGVAYKVRYCLNVADLQCSSFKLHQVSGHIHDKTFQGMWWVELRTLTAVN